MSLDNKSNNKQNQNHLLNNLSKGQLLALIATGALLIFALIYSIINLSYQSGKILTSVKYAPYSASVSLNGKEIKNNANNYIEPGEYTVEVKLENFDTLTQKVIITETDHLLVGVLNPSNDAGIAYAEGHRQDFTEVQAAIGQKLNLEGASLKENYPILKYLPYNNALYSISYTYRNYSEDQSAQHKSELGEPLITIKAQIDQLEAAITKFKDFCKDSEDNCARYEVNFTGFENPFLENKAELANSYYPSDAADFITKAYGIDGTYRQMSLIQQIGDFYVAKLQEYNYDQDILYAPFIVIVEEHDGNWRVVSTPQAYVTKYNTKGLTEDQLKQANSF